MSHLAEHVTDISYTASAITVLTGTLTWLNDNAGAVGALCAIGGLIVAIATYRLNKHYKQRK